MRPLIKKIQGMLAVTFLGGCRLQPIPPDDGGVYEPDAAMNDGATDASHDGGIDVDGGPGDASLDVSTDAPDETSGDAASDAALD